MKITESQVIKLTVTGAKNTDGFTLDPISIYLEDFGQGRGRLTVGCWDATWSYFWGAMGNRSLAEFIIKANNSYLAGKLKREGEKFTELDVEALETQVKQAIIKQRREGDIDEFKARELWGELDCADFSIQPFSPTSDEADLLGEVLGDDWWDGMPERTSSHGQWLWDILNVVREVLQQRTEIAAA